MEENNWYYNEIGKPIGPVTLADLRQLFTVGRVNVATLVWHQTLVQWTAAGQVPGLLPPAPPPIIPMATPNFQSPFNSAFPSMHSSSYHGMAVTAFVLSLIGMFIPVIGLLFLSIPGLILGIIALSGMSRTRNREGHGLAVAAIVLGAIACICHCGLGASLLGPNGHWRYEFHRQVPWNGWNT